MATFSYAGKLSLHANTGTLAMWLGTGVTGPNLGLPYLDRASMASGHLHCWSGWRLDPPLGRLSKKVRD